jgi:hypothetical protein
MKKQQFRGTTCQKWVWHSHVQKPISNAHALEGGVACTAVIVQSPEVNTTKKHSLDPTVSKPIQKQHSVIRAV